MKLCDDFPGGGFSVRYPATRVAPFVFNSPHSGRVYPDRFLAMSRLDSLSIRRSEDVFVDELFSGCVGLGAPMMMAHFPRAYLDVNREPFELDPKMFRDPLPPQANTRSARVAGGLGTVPRLVGEGQEIYGERLPYSEADGRIQDLYLPYHDRLGELLAETVAGFGVAVLIDCHSMPGSIRIADHGARPDFIVGDRFGTSASPYLSEAVIGLLRGLGYSVAHNRPYAGGFITEHYGRPAQALHAVQIEVNRALYMNERTLRKGPGFDPLADDLTRLCADLMRIWADLTCDGLPLAAE